MTWKDTLSKVTLPDGRRLIGASFRGVPFMVEASERSGGRRVNVHEFPFRDDPFVEDVGRGVRVFRLDGHVVGDDYVAQKNALLSALEDVEGPGELVHPYYGRKRVVCAGITVREAVSDGRMASFSLEFLEAPLQAVVPADGADLNQQLELSADAAMVAVTLEFENSYIVDGQPSFAVASLALELSNRTEGLREVLSGVVSATQELARLDVEIQSLVSQSTSIIQSPTEVLSSFVSVFDLLTETIAESPRKVMQAMLAVYAIEPVTPAIVITSTRERERSNQEAILAALRRALLIEACRLAPKIIYETTDEAVADVVAITDLLDEQSLIAGDVSYPALNSLRSWLVRAVPGDSVRARLLTVDQRVPIPSIVLSYQLYGSVDEELDIVARNRAPHPGVLFGSLQVLSDA